LSIAVEPLVQVEPGARIVRAAMLMRPSGGSGFVVRGWRIRGGHTVNERDASWGKWRQRAT
jgi:hypothetical protein